MDSDLKMYKGVLVRKDNPSDAGMVKECLANYSDMKIDSESVVLDLGAHVGGFAVMAINRGIKRYIGVEADQENFGILSKNIQRVIEHMAISTREKVPECCLFSGATTTLQDPYVTFYTRRSKQAKCSGSATPRKVTKALDPVQVPNWNVDNLIAAHTPTHIKMDIEGAEIDILKTWDYIIPDGVEEIAIEIHSTPYCMEYETQHHQKILDQGFKLVHARPNHGFKNKGKEWTCFGETHNSVLFGFDLLYSRRQ